MKKKLLYSLIVPMFAVFAIVGSAFSLWFFKDTSVSENQDVNKEVTQLVAVGTIAKADDFKIVFDQTEEGRQTNGAVTDSKVAANGITLDFGEKTNKKAVYTSPSQEEGVDKTDDGNVYHVMTVKIKISTTLAGYLDVKYNTEAGVVSTEDDNTVVTFILGNNVDEFDWEKVALSYKNEPANKEAYNTFKGIVNSASISVEYTVDVLAK